MLHFWTTSWVASTCCLSLPHPTPAQSYLHSPRPCTCHRATTPQQTPQRNVHHRGRRGRHWPHPTPERCDHNFLRQCADHRATTPPYPQNRHARDRCRAFCLQPERSAKLAEQRRQNEDEEKSEKKEQCTHDHDGVQVKATSTGLIAVRTYQSSDGGIVGEFSQKHFCVGIVKAFAY
jgi:hypothetical protein